MTAPLLEIDSVFAGYDELTVLRGITLSIQPGSRTALLGRNGVGKTTLLGVISGLLRARSGSVRFAGHDVTRMPSYRRTALGLCHIPEGRGIHRTLTVRENMIMHARPGGTSAVEAVDLAVQAFPALRDRLRHAAGTLSGGQQQMLALSRAYIQQPTLVLVDEPSLGLAPQLVEAVYEHLGNLVERGIAVLIVDQISDQLIGTVDHAYVLDRGLITREASSAELAGVDILAGFFGNRSNASVATAPEPTT